ncbi:hypothetical protein [Micromonospora chersina]
MNRSRYNKIADAAYDRIAEGSDEFDIADVIDEIVRELSSEDASTELIREFAQTLAARVDDKRAKRAESGQVDLLTGDAEALDAVWRIGGGKRVRAREANRTQITQWIGIRGDNAARVVAAYDRDRKQVAELLVYMPDEETTVEQAVDRRKQERPPLV